jgi:4-hydroxybenzoate polyprenyltransferase
VGLAYAGAWLCLGAACTLGGMKLPGLPFLAGVAILLAWQVARLNIADPRACLRLFKHNRATGLAVAAALLAGRW